jgi:phasin family protein
MSKKRTAKKSSGSPRKKSAALNYNPATMFDIGQFFNTGKTEKIMSQGKNQFDKLTNDATAFSRDGFDAFNKSMSIFAKGFEDIIRASMSIAQTSAEKQGQLVKEALSTKSLNEWADIQNKIAQTSFDDVIAAATKLSEMGVKVFTQGSEPINSSLTKGMKKASEAMAA